MVFGPSLVDAYLLEKDVAKYPRIILNDNVIEKITSANLLDIERLNTLITKDKDGNSYIDYFSKAVHELVDPPNEFPEYITILAQKIKHGIQSKNKDIRIKYEWMKEKYNILVEFCKSEDFLSKMPAKDTHEFYLGLHKIK